MKSRRDWIESYRSKHWCLHCNDDVEDGSKTVESLGPTGPLKSPYGLFTLHRTGIGGGTANGTDTMGPGPVPFSDQPEHFYIIYWNLLIPVLWLVPFLCSVNCASR